ncbi:hypothetical protein [Dietzia sp. ANT_WB102]|uniref:hypothetical protein n=1 Tax=Dietzia sp. ANT_WB102 TaxID=2597345 RepID=UPI0011EBB18B|nr:hypothetical protein [Dietzia sp. ANT_WB102]KAA0916465.1 hypothetical protein FQ137_14680 [Dietzia sp. ANT_WB102]
MYGGDPVADFWHGRITARRLVVLINGLPPDSALHRAQTGGHVWTWTESLLWMIVYLLQVIDQRLVWQKRAKPKMPKWTTYPWSTESTSGSGSKKLGDRGELTNEQVEAWLDTIRPPQQSQGGDQ